MFGGSAAMERILIVEDDRPVQRILKRLFEFEGYGVEASADGESALAAFHLVAPTAIVLDLNLPANPGQQFSWAKLLGDSYSEQEVSRLQHYKTSVRLPQIRQSFAFGPCA